VDTPNKADVMLLTSLVGAKEPERMTPR
jgi:hypothetical protein